ncbi:MAG TPA: DUF87 domain-containing protein [Allosphingosinicella sp.]|nr:DUF87 domain-containing protein [Allosphingosinicella sp.]
MIARPIPDEALNSHIGILGEVADGGPMALDLDRLIGSHACIVANSGGGKSGLIRRLLEVTHGHVQHIVLDVEDEFYTLRERFEYVIAGGDDPDAPATVENAHGLARASLEHGFSLIAQINDLGDDAPAFVGRFLDSLMSAPRELWRPLLVVIDETQRFAPVTGGTDATDGVKALVQRGRKRGFTGIFASLALSEINPRVRGLVNNWMLGRVGQSLDRKTMAQQLGFAPSSAEAKGLQSLEPRHFWGFGPALTPIPALFRVAEVETTPVRPGDAKVPTPPAPEALRTILAGLASVEVPSDSKGPATIPQGVVPSWPDQRKEVEALKAANASLEGALRRAGRLVADADAAIQAVHRALTEIPITIPAPGGGAPAKPRRERATPPKASPTRPEGSVAPRAEGLPPRHRRILDAIAWCATFLGRTGVPRGIVAWIADVSSKSSSYANDISALRTRGLIDYPNAGDLALTTQGAGIAAWPDAPPTREALRDAVSAQLAPRQVNFLNVLWSHGRLARLSRDDLALKAGVSASSSSFANDISRLRALGIIDYPAPGEVSLGSIFDAS